MQKARCHSDRSELQPLVGAWFQGLFTPLLEVLFTFPVRYLFAIGLLVVFRLGRWCCQVQTGFLRPRPTQGTARSTDSFAYGAFTRCGAPSQTLPLKTAVPRRSPTTPPRTRDGLASSAFARHYLRNHSCFLFLPLLRCFSSGGWQLLFTDLQSVGFPHSDTRGSIGRLHLPAHFRSLPRPSSPPGAKASPVRPYSLPTLCQLA